MNGAGWGYLTTLLRLFQRSEDAAQPPSSEPLAQHTTEFWDEYHRRLDVLRSRYPTMRAAELHHRALPPVEAPAAPSKPEPSKERTQAQKIWPYLP
jgi:hypothetical protein